MSKIRVALLVGEFFDNTLRRHNVFGGYGMLARNYIAEHVPCEDITVETILGFNDGPTLDTAVVDGRKRVIALPLPRTLPSIRGARRCLGWMMRRLDRRALTKYLSAFDVFLGIETMEYVPTVMSCARDRRFILYMQDPRPQSDWDDLDTVFGTDDGSPRPNSSVRAFYKTLVRENRLVGISQGQDLIAKAKELYELPSDLSVQLVRNPVALDNAFDLDSQVKENAVLFLGRLDFVKRPWLALEVARLMPEVQFYFLGKAHNDVVSYIVQPYRDLPNVHLLGHQAGEVKTDLLRRCKVLINTSIHEAIPVSFLEALAYGTLIVSCQNPDGMTAKFGAFTGRVLGDGRDKADLFVKGIQSVLGDETARRTRAREARAYTGEMHDVMRWTNTMREVIRAAVR